MAIPVRQIIIDGFLYKEEAELHDFLALTFNNGTDYGQNHTALWAILVEAERPIHITWKNFKTSQRRWVQSAEVFAQVFRDIAAYDTRIGRLRKIEFEIQE